MAKFRITFQNLRYFAFSTLFLYSAVLKIWKHNLPLKCAFSGVFYPMFANCIHVKRCKPKFVHAWEKNLRTLKFLSGHVEYILTTLPKFSARSPKKIIIITL